MLTPVRPLTEDDVDEVVDLANVCEIAETGETDPELIDWIRGGSATAALRMFGIDDDAGLAAFGYVECAGGHTALSAELRVRPGLDLGLGGPLLAAVRVAAADFDPHKPLHMFANTSAAAQRRWLESQGATEVRRFWRMAIELDESPEVPPAPPGVTLRTVRDDDADLRSAFDVVETSFAEHFGHAGDRDFDTWIGNWRSRAGFDLSLWWFAYLDGAPVAVLLAQMLDGAGHVGSLGTLAAARGRGIGAHLLRHSFAEFYRRGVTRVTLGVDSENGTGAVRLYESVGMHADADWALYELPPLRPYGPAGSTRSDSKPT